MPFASLPGTWISLGWEAPPQRITRSYSFPAPCRKYLSNICVADKLDAGSLHDFDSSVDDALVQLHIRNAVAQQTADSVMTFIDRYAVSAFVQVPGCRQSGRTAADDRDLLSGAYLWFFAFYQTIRVSIFNDRTFIFLRGNRFACSPQVQAASHSAGQTLEVNSGKQ